MFVSVLRSRAFFVICIFIAGYFAGFISAKGVVRFEWRRLWKSDPPAPVALPPPLPPAKTVPGRVPTLRSAKGFQKPSLYLGCKNVKLEIQIQKNQIQELYLGGCRAGVLQIKCTSPAGICGLAGRLGPVQYEGQGGSLEVPIPRNLDISAVIAAIASGSGTYTIQIEN